MRPIIALSFVAAMIPAAIVPAALPAQDVPNFSPDPVTIAGIYAYEPQFDPSVLRATVHAKGGAKKGGAKKGGKAAEVKAAGGLGFTASKSRRAANLAAIVRKKRPNDPKGAAAMEKVFASTDIIASLGKVMATFGLRTDNVADAYALWWFVAWHAANGLRAEPDRTTILAVRAQAATGLLAAGKIARATDARKQELTEFLLIQAALIDAANTDYRGDPKLGRALAEAVEKGSRASGLDLSTMTLTPKGFRAR